MEEKKKSKFKEFCEKHEAAVDGLMIGAMIGVSYAVGCVVGDRFHHYKIEFGLRECFKVDPELEGRMLDAIKKVQEAAK